MIRVLILKDEIPARKKLQTFLKELDTPTKIIAEIGTVAKAVSFLQNNYPDVILSDIELMDGNVFEIYQQVAISCPIIFTTAYDQYWMNAFETNGIDYLLKPFSRDRFKKAWSKFLLLRERESESNMLFHRLANLIDRHSINNRYRKRLSIQAGRSIYFLDIGNVVLFESNSGVVYAYDNLGKKHLLNFQTLKEIEAFLDPADFFRINRSELISKQHIEKMERFTKNIVAVKMKGYPNYYKTSQSNTAVLRQWMDK